MVFSSTIFLFAFLPIVTGLYFVVPRPAKNTLLLVASLVFYAWGEGTLVLLLIVSATFNYGAARMIAGQLGTERARALLVGGISCNLLLLGYFKYAGFLVENFNDLASFLGFQPIPFAGVGLPIGISFFTFQAISYLVDVYRGSAMAQRRFVDAALYIALFPQLIAGPIIRYHDVDIQLRERQITLALFADGTRRFIIGLGKKVLIANPLGLAADQIFALPAHELSWQLAWLGALCYTFQIYMDFSGYSDMAIGLGRMFGFRFLENFNYPYISRSIREFWRRWHISLSNWFRDYLYVPLGGSRKGSVRLYRNLLIVFVLCGFWHGASWTFLIWGLYHGLFLTIERIGLERGIARLWRPVQHLYALLVIVVGWVFFRSESLIDALTYLRAMTGASGVDTMRHPIGLYLTNEVALTLIVAAIASTGVYPWLVRHATDLLSPGDLPIKAPASGSALLGVIEPAYLLLVFVVATAYVAAGTYNPFIYFRF